MSQPLPEVTVIIPTHNHEKWVADAIRSVADQDYPRKRIVVVDDGSTDKTKEAVIRTMYRPMVPSQQEEVWHCIGKVLNSDTSIMFHSVPTANGPSFARNLGLRVSWDTAEVFMFLDSDDYFLPGKMRKSVEVWLRQPEVIGMVYSDYETETPDGFRTRIWSEPYCRIRLAQDNIINPLSLVSKLALSRCGVFDEELRTCEDFDLWLRLSEQFAIYHIPESLAIKRVGPHDSTSTVAKERWAQDYTTVKRNMAARAKGMK